MTRFMFEPPPPWGPSVLSVHSPLPLPPPGSSVPPRRRPLDAFSGIRRASVGSCMETVLLPSKRLVLSHRQKRGEEGTRRRQRVGGVVWVR